jgi:hypothetical protein
VELQLLHDDNPELETTVISGATEPIQGWMSRYYGHKQAAPVIATTGLRQLPATLTTLIHLGSPMTDETLQNQKEALQQLLAAIEKSAD